MTDNYVDETSFYLAFVELYNPYIHGINDEKIYNHYFVDYLMKHFDFLDILSLNRIYLRNLNKKIKYIRYIEMFENKTHPFVSNYLNMLIYTKIKNTCFDIIQKIIVIDYEGNEIICCVKKTYLIRLIQRRWKNVIKERKRVLQKRCSFNSILYRQKNGKWDSDCFYYPTLQGMMSFLK